MNFRSLVSADVWRDLIERGRRRTYPSNAVLPAQGESPDCVIALVDGLVKVAQSNECGAAPPRMPATTAPPTGREGADASDQETG